MNVLRRSFRSLSRQPLLFSASVATLALGLAVCLVGVSLLESILLQPLPYPDPDRLVAVWNVERNNPSRQLPVSRRMFDESRSSSRVFSQLGAARDWSFVVPAPDGPEQFRGALVSEDFFTVLGAPLAAGRLFTPEDVAGDIPTAAILSHRSWQALFGGDRSAIGKPIVLDQRQFTIVGILADSFSFLPWPDSDIWVPLNLDPDQERFPDLGNLWVVGRLSSSVSLAEAETEMDLFAARVAEFARAENKDFEARVVPLHEQFVGSSRSSLIVVWAATVLVLLIGCCNVVGLLVARWLSQRREFAIRAAIGASPSQLVLGIVYDVFWIVALGAGAGLLLAGTLIDAIVALNPTLFPRIRDVGVNWAGASFTVILCITAIVGVGLPSILGTVRVRVAEGLKLQRSESARPGRKWRGLDTLVALETALAFAMVTVTLLMFQTVSRMQSFDLGFNTSGVLTGRLPFSISDYPAEDNLHIHYRSIIARLSAQPGVSHVGASTSLPLSGVRETVPVSVDNTDPTRFPYAQVSAGYFATMQVSVLRGREFTEADDKGSPPVVIVDAAFAQSHFGGEDPIGKLIEVGNAPRTSCEIVGVAGNVRQFGPRSVHEPMVYFPFLQRTRWNSFIVLRARSPSIALLSDSLRHAASAIDKKQLVANVRTMQDRLRARLRRPKFTLILFAWFGFVALGLGMVGVYSVTSFLTRRQSKDHGVQLALGAPPGRLARAVVIRGIRPVLVGLLGGLAIAVSFGRLLESQLFGVSPLDPTAFAAGLLILILAGVAGSYLPARWATQVDPLQAIRTE